MLLLAVAALAPLHFHVDASEFANAVYHVACVTGFAPCTKPAFLRFWNEQYSATKEDGERFDGFAAAMRELSDLPDDFGPTPFMPNYTGYYPAMRQRTRVLAAAFGANSGAEFRRRAQGLGKRETIDRMAEVLDAAERRLHPWWTETGAPLIAKRVKPMQEQVERLKVARLATEMAAFLEVDRFARDVYIHLIPSPEYDGKEAAGSPDVNHFCVELTRDAEDRGAAWFAIHELTHSLYDAAPSAKKLALMREFAASADPAAQGLYMYINEAVATAVQLLILERNGQRDDDPYHDRYIPRLAFQTLPLLRDALNRRATLYKGFAAAYLAAARRALGNEADSLAFRFSTPGVIGPPELRRAFLEAFAPRWYAADEPAPKMFTRLAVVRLVMADGTQRGTASISDGGQLVLAGRDAAAIADLAKKALEWKGTVAPGLLFTVE